MKTSTSITKIAPALLAAQKEMGNAVKGASNPYFKSKFADLNSVREAVTPALHKHGIALLQLNGHAGYGSEVPVVITTLLHESGEYITSETQIVVKQSNDPQAYGSAVSYARRYGLSSMLSIGAEDDDGEQAMVRTSTKETKPTTKTTTAPITNGAEKVSSFGSFRKPVTTNG